LRRWPSSLHHILGHARLADIDAELKQLGPTTAKALSISWAWAGKPPHSTLTIPAEIHEAVMALPPNERRDRAKVNEAVREGLRLGPLRPAGSEDQYGVPKATE
jgi:hypothetical protein